jgi:hypothetical protein
LNINAASDSFGTLNPNITSGVGLNTGINQPFQSPGFGSQRDDNSGLNPNALQRTINSNFQNEIVPLPNVLDQYASYTYSLSWYLITPEQFNQLQKNNKIDPSAWSLLVQSGGAPVKATGGEQTNRNQYFKYDYYLDNLVMQSLFSSSGSGSAHNVATLSFTVVEPLGITLVKNMYNAVNDLYKSKNVNEGSSNFVAANYVMSVRFYGYDVQGNLAKRPQYPNYGGYTGDAYSIVEKYVPFIIKNIEYNVTTKGVIEYKVDAAATPYSYNTSTAYGSIPSQFELVGETVDDILNGKKSSTKPGTGEGRKESPQPDNNLGPATPASTNSNNGWGEG